MQIPDKSKAITSEWPERLARARQDAPAVWKGTNPQRLLRQRFAAASVKQTEGCFGFLVLNHTFCRGRG